MFFFFYDVMYNRVYFVAQLWLHLITYLLTNIRMTEITSPVNSAKGEGVKRNKFIVINKNTTIVKIKTVYLE